MSKKILLVDDEEEIVLLIKRRLIKKGYDIITAHNGREGLETAQKERPDLVILDVMMPELDGYQVCRMLKFDTQYQDIKVILVTARDQQMDKEMGREVGSDGYVTKPFDPEALFAKIESLIGPAT